MVRLVVKKDTIKTHVTIRWDHSRFYNEHNWEGLSSADNSISDTLPNLNTQGSFEFVKFHTCSRHTQCDGKNKLRMHGFGFLEKGTNCMQDFVS